MAWAQVKGHITANTKNFNLTEVEQLAWEAFEIVTATCWHKLIKHMQEKVEDLYWACDGLYLQFVDRFIICFSKEDSDSGDENDKPSSSECNGSTDNDCSTTSDEGGSSDQSDASCCEHFRLDTTWNY